MGNGSDGPTGVSPCNTGETSQNLGTPPGRAGLDTVAFLLDHEGAREDGSSESPVRVDERRAGGMGSEYRYMRWMPSGARLSWGVGTVARVEASVAKHAGQWQALAVDHAWPVLWELWLEACEYVKPVRGETLDGCRLTRLDCTRDVGGVLDVGQALDAFASRPLDQRWKKRRYADADANSAQTYRVGPRAWSHVGYDKAAETAGKAPEGTLRLETRATRDLLHSGPVVDAGAAMGRVADLDADRVDTLSRLIVSRTGMDQKVAAMDQVARSIMAHPLLSDRERMACLGYAASVSLGMSPPVSKNSATKYRRVLEDLGVTPAAGCLEGSEDLYAMWLDLDRDEAVYSAA